MTSLIGGFVNKRITIVHLVKIDGHIRLARFIPGGFDAGNGAQRRQTRDVVADPSPGFPPSRVT